MSAPSEMRQSSAIVVPFPYVHRRVFIERQALRAAELNPCAGERHLQYQVQVQIDAMRRRGICEALICREARCLEAAMRAALRRTVDTIGARR
jgi:hypothetical protein